MMEIKRKCVPIISMHLSKCVQCADDKNNYLLIDLSRSRWLARVRQQVLVVLVQAHVPRDARHRRYRAELQIKGI